MYSIFRTSKFDRDVKQCNKRRLDIDQLAKAIECLRSSGTLPVITTKKYKPHKLIGNYVHHWEGHIEPDWLLIWLVNHETKVVTLVRTGTHADLF